jgi:GGDEF domain-containing protein
MTRSMSDSAFAGLRALGYRRARLLLLSAGLGVLAVTALTMYIRRVDTTEVAATLLFMPVLVGFVLWGLRGGVAAGVLAAIGYALLRYPAIDAVGAGRFTELIASRALAFLGFGVIGGWSSRQLEASIEKLELYDHIDDATGLFNARFFIEDTDLEMSRSQRYQTIFSVATVTVAAGPLEAVGRRRRRAILRDLGRMLTGSVRSVDRPVHARDLERHRIAVVLPETGAEGARIFGERLADRVVEYLEHRGAKVGPQDVEWAALTWPQDEEAMEVLRQQFGEIDRAEHPEAQEARP